MAPAVCTYTSTGSWWDWQGFGEIPVSRDVREGDNHISVISIPQGHPWRMEVKPTACLTFNLRVLYQIVWWRHIPVVRGCGVTDIDYTPWKGRGNVLGEHKCPWGNVSTPVNVPAGAIIKWIPALSWHRYQFHKIICIKSLKLSLRLWQF